MALKADSKEKIILPKDLQREMIKFFLRTSVPKMAALGRQRQQTSQNSDEAKDR